MVPKRDRLEFVPPPGVKASSNPFPHGLYYRRAADVPAAIRALCYPWPTPAYPWASDPLELRGSVSAGSAIWRAFSHLGATKGRPMIALHLARIAGTEDAAACGDPLAQIVKVERIDGFALACTSCLAMTERS